MTTFTIKTDVYLNEEDGKSFYLSFDHDMITFLDGDDLIDLLQKLISIKTDNALFYEKRSIIIER